MKIGVFIRSVGERTERLAYDSVAQAVDKENIYLLKNYYPSYKAFLKMLKIAQKKRFDWFLGLDADVVLKNGWFNSFLNFINEREASEYFRIYFNVFDRVTQKRLVRGNNFYNGKYVDLCIKYLKQNINIGRFWFYYKRKGFNSGYFTKPETSIRTHMREKLKVYDIALDELIGWHGFEQYYCEIFRQYVTRFHRDVNFINKDNFFLMKEEQQKLFRKKDYDRYVANIAWNSANRWRIKRVDARLNSEYSDFIRQFRLTEKEPLESSLDDFYKKYLLPDFDD